MGMFCTTFCLPTALSDSDSSIPTLSKEYVISALLCLC